MRFTQTKLKDNKLDLLLVTGLFHKCYINKIIILKKDILNSLVIEWAHQFNSDFYTSKLKDLCLGG